MKRGKPFSEQMTEEMWERAWCLKMKGFTNAQIAEKIGLSEGCYEAHKWEFARYYARKVREFQRLQPATKKINLRQEKMKAAAVELAKLGENVSQIADQLGIPYGTLKTWTEVDEVFGHAIRTAKDAADQQVIRSLYRRATGFTVRQTVRNVMKDARGNIVADNIVITTKKLAPNLGSIKLWLVNRRQWISEVEGNNVSDDSSRVEYDVREGLYSGADD